VLNTFPPRNQRPDPKSLKGFSSLFPFPKIKVESSKIKGSKPINELIPKNQEHRSGSGQSDFGVDFLIEFLLSRFGTWLHVGWSTGLPLILEGVVEDSYIKQSYALCNKLKKKIENIAMAL